MDYLVIDENNLQDLINKQYILYDNNKKILIILKKFNIKLIIKIKEIEELSCNRIKYLDITDLINLKKLKCSNSKLNRIKFK